MDYLSNSFQVFSAIRNLDKLTLAQRTHDPIIQHVSFQKADINLAVKPVFLNLRELKNEKRALFYYQVIKHNFPFYTNHLFSVRNP